MIANNLKAMIEAILFVVGEDGINLKNLSTILELNVYEIEPIINEMKTEWQEQKRGLQILKTAQVYKMATLPEHSDYIRKLASVPISIQLSRASLETLAIIAYKQPITRLELEEIRGIKSERTIQILQRKGLIDTRGRASAPGRPILYGTTNEFLDYFGLNHLDELPSLESIFEEKEREENKRYLFQKLGLNKY